MIKALRKLGLSRAMSARTPASALFRAGNRHRDAKEWEQAARSYQAGLELAPNAQAIWVQLGHVLKEAGFTTQAEAAYLKALALLPEDSDIHVQLGHLYTQIENGTKAATHYETAIKYGSRDHNALNWLATKARERRDWLGVIDCYQKLVEARPNDGKIWIQLGHAYKESALFSQAEHAYRRAIDSLTELDDAHLQLGHLYNVMNDQEKAATHYALSAQAGSRDKHVRPYAPKGAFSRALLIALSDLMPDSSRRQAVLEIKVHPSSFARLILQSLQ